MQKLPMEQPVTLDAVSISGDEVEFQARSGDRRYVAYGTYRSRGEWSVIHGPTQEDVDAIAGLLEDRRARVTRRGGSKGE